MPARVLLHARRAALLLLVVLAVVAVWAVVAGLRARTHLEHARDDLVAVRTHPPDDADALRVRLARDAREARRARSLMHQPGPTVASWVPLLGRTVRAERTVADAATAVLDTARAVAADATALADGDGIDLRAVRRLQRDLIAGDVHSERPLRDLATLRTGFTPGFVQRQVRVAQTTLGPVGGRFGRTALLMESVAAMLGANGPRTVMVGLANNAELRGTGGLVSSVAMGRGENGRLTIGDFRDVRDVADPPEKARTVPAPASYVAHFGAFKANTTIWKNATMSAAGPASMSVLAELAGLSLGRRPDVVVLLDVPAMAEIVAATGQPLRLPDGERVGGAALVRALLVESYGAATSDTAVQTARRRALQQAAGRAFGAVANERPGLALLRAVATAAAERHLMLWASRPAEQRGFLAGDVAGSVDAVGTDVAMVSLNNLGDSVGTGNKLDFYASRRLDVSVVVGDDSARVRQTLTIRNAAPAGLGPYVAGIAHPGRLQELLEIAVAGDAALEGFTRDGASVGARVLREDGTRRLTTAFTLERGRATTFAVTYQVPLRDGVYRLRLVPQPLASPARLVVDVRGADGVALRGTDSTLLHDGSVHRDAEWTGVAEIAVRADDAGGWRTRLARFWNTKVSFG